MVLVLHTDVYRYYLKWDQDWNRLDWVITSVDVVAHEEVVSVGWFSPNSEQFNEVVKLSVNVPAYRHRAFDLLNIWFLWENFLSLRAWTRTLCWTYTYVGRYVENILVLIEYVL